MDLGDIIALVKEYFLIILLEILSDFFYFGYDETFFECEFELNTMSFVFEFVNSLFLNILIPVLIVSNTFEKLHQVNMLAYFFDPGLMDRFFDSSFPIDLINDVFDIRLGKRICEFISLHFF